MIHILTVHWKEDHWIDTQLKYLRDNISEPFKVYAFLNDVAQLNNAKFFYCSTEPIVAHAVKLNLLADIAGFNADDSNDLLMFLDGDAFPVGDIISFGREKLKSYPLIAIQRRENNGDIQPHPSFCLTTVGFWKSIHGDWKKGFRWNNLQGESITDVGGNLLGILKQKNIDWWPMLRSNRREVHPLFYGLYADLIYHHGAGFRKSFSRLEKATKLNKVNRRIAKLFEKCSDTGLLKGFKAFFDPAYKLKSENNLQSQKVFEMIQNDSEFYRYFMEVE